MKAETINPECFKILSQFAEKRDLLTIPAACILADGLWWGNIVLPKTCDAMNMYKDSSAQCVGTGQSYFIYDL